jgi:hypothetical protein
VSEPGRKKVSESLSPLLGESKLIEVVLMAVDDWRCSSEKRRGINRLGSWQ